ncbi:MAG: hypothetical protein JNN03_00810 [Rubrivivax sp.]|nr:hypothetical protein [Rubrivivax sp.]
MGNPNQSDRPDDGPTGAPDALPSEVPPDSDFEQRRVRTKSGGRRMELAARIAHIMSAPPMKPSPGVETLPQEIAMLALLYAEAFRAAPQQRFRSATRWVLATYARRTEKQVGEQLSVAVLLGLYQSIRPRPVSKPTSGSLNGEAAC